MPFLLELPSPNTEERYQTAKDLLIDLKNLKHKQEFEAELERSASPDSISKPPIAATGSGTAVATSKESAVGSGETAVKTTSNAEYIVSGIMQHKKATAVAFMALLLGGVGLYFLLRPTTQPKETSSPQASGISSVAVLPFVNVSGNADIEYLSDGISESLINSLSRLPQLKVIARSSAFKYVLSLEPESAASLAYLGYSYAMKGQYAEAIAAYQKEISLEGEKTTFLCYLGHAYARWGKREEALAVLDKLKRAKEHVSPAELADFYTGLGDKEAAFESLERAYAAHDPQLQFLKVSPFLDPLHSDPRFQDLVRRVGLLQ